MEMEGRATDFVREIVARDVESGRHGGRVATRFPPEPNGYPHIGHAKAICLDFGIAEEFGGTCNLRMDDTNPTTEDPAFVAAFERDIRWLGFEWNPPTRYASDYFELLYQLAIGLIEDGKAYVDSASEEEIRAHRGTVTEPGRPTRWRDRPADESLDLFVRMRAGEFADGTHVLRGKADLASPNMKMRDPLLYRIRHAHHYRTGDAWPIYPMYDWAHALSDAIEGITHSLCTLEFENNREVYDWVVDHTRPGALDLTGQGGAAASDGPGAWDPRPRQYEFARLNLEYTIMSKRKLAGLVREGRVEGWDDPRMPTLAGLRRRGVTPEAIRSFCSLVGVSRAEQRVDIGKLEYATRDDLNQRAPRVMCVLEPLRLVIDNYPETQTEELDAPSFPPDIGKPGSRPVPFSRVLFIERDDFHEAPPKGFYRLAPGREVRLRHAYFVTCTGVVRDEETGEATQVHCTYDPDTRGGSAPDGRKVPGTIHWVSAPHSLPCEARLYDRLFSVSDPAATPPAHGRQIEAGSGREQPSASAPPAAESQLNPESLVVMPRARIEPSVAGDPPGTHYQFERRGYFVSDPASSPDALVFNRTVTLRDTWTKRQQAKRQARRRSTPPGGRAATAAGSRDTAPPRPPRTAPPASAGASTEAGSRSTAAPADPRADSPELAERYGRYREELGLSADDADVLTRSPEMAEFFEAALTVHPHPQAVANWLIHELRGAMVDGSVADLPFRGPELGSLVALVEAGTISQPVAKDVLGRMLDGGGDPRQIVEREHLERIDDPAALAPIVDRLLADHPDEVERYRAGQAGLAGFFVGGVLGETGGRADPELVQSLVRERLSGKGGE